MVLEGCGFSGLALGAFDCSGLQVLGFMLFFGSEHTWGLYPSVPWVWGPFFQDPLREYKGP